MKTYFLDFETYYTKEYSLRNMTPVEYILDPRFEAIGCAVLEDADARWIEGPDLPAFFKSLKNSGDTIQTVTHNALFDNCIMAWRFDFVPDLMTDTLGVTRACLGHELRSHALSSVATKLGLGAKGNTIADACGMNLAAIQANGAFYLEYITYALNDVQLCKGIYDKLVRGRVFPASELLVMDVVLRCAVNPKLRLDWPALCMHYNRIQREKDALLCRVGVGKEHLMSNDLFALLLRAHGVEPPTKISRVTGKETYAFAKTDRALIELEQHPDPAVQALVAARVGHRSTIEETRTKRLLSIADLSWPRHMGRNDAVKDRLMPVPLRYSAAHTHRLGGDWKLNMQNMPRKSPIRSALVAPPGHTIITADAAQIEARGVAYVSGEDGLVAQFANNEDVYSNFAGGVFGHLVSKKDHPDKRFVGKVCILGLGYQSGWLTLQDALRVQSKLQLGQEMIVPNDEAQRYVRVYRSSYPAIQATWNLLNTIGLDILTNGGTPWEFGPVTFEKGSILLPSGLRLWYSNLCQSKEDGNWWFDYAGKPEKLYGGKLLENIIQALARIITMDAAVRIQKRLRPLKQELALQAHDELVYVVPDEHVLEVKKVLSEEMCRRPSWAPKWPLAVEINTGKSYGDAK